ncbi:hypothetical protein [Pseudonocardia abyssalis]|uniref:Uncharacterized protein n=1 Tax=Pseudonocardia abyssalis TaxID=2792008 RepID=A0ABS6USF0_9PSEU|nr:hypothetical protein [Pseudonocardia abyssalis]MBW0113853.1 hypothetical protein [Pseudonocardia abyssalis]MBW0135150.1 hypothetical protein [Pseudonocardia abyssalis]
MYRKLKRRRQLSKARPGDGSRLQRFRLWHLPSRSLFALESPDGSGRPRRWVRAVRPALAVGLVISDADPRHSAP